MRCFKKLETFMNDFNIGKKLLIIYVFCVILPLVLTDSIILYMIYDAGQKEQLYEYENISNSIRYDFEYTFEDAVNQMNDVYMDSAVNDFLNQNYENPYDFFEANVALTGRSSLNRLGGYNISNAVIYADNDTIINGGHFSQLSGVKDTVWYQNFLESGGNMSVSFYYIGDEDMSALLKRRISLVRRLDFFKKEGCEKILRLDVDYNQVARKLSQLNYGYGVYICQGDRILFSNRGHSGSNENFHYLTGTEDVAYKSTFNLYGEDIDILCMKAPSSLLSQLKKHMPLLFFLLVANLILPVIMVSIVNRSFTRRLWELGAAFEKVEDEGTMQGIEQVQGADEIGTLMRNYNRMVERMNELIQRVYKDRLERQEIELARQNAELLALHSQINPHFLFNVLESIRMHCVIQKEEKTAGMIEKLAVLERQNINWASDDVKLSEEISFVEAYLELQKYRFGDRLHYEIELEESCAGYYIPKLTLTTFVENSCVHGMERKTAACWIYVRIYEKNGQLYMEIEDTGGGMEERAVEQINLKMQNCSIEDIRENEHVGIINACLRLKRFAQGHADFFLESEMGVGTFTTIRVDVEYLRVNTGE
ncbi:MAG: histidine kinase [Lachnospiraceae bacterium]|nr:histidine kinase [Lachnospiraceae bacterium]